DRPAGGRAGELLAPVGSPRPDLGGARGSASGAEPAGRVRRSAPARRSAPDRVEEGEREAPGERNSGAGLGGSDDRTGRGGGSGVGSLSQPRSGVRRPVRRNEPAG